jgi:hypothetical protein
MNAPFLYEGKPAQMLQELICMSKVLPLEGVFCYRLRSSFRASDVNGIEQEKNYKINTPGSMRSIPLFSYILLLPCVYVLFMYFRCWGANSSIDITKHGVRFFFLLALFVIDM